MSLITLHIAVKRAKHFVAKAGLTHVGPFTPTGTTGLAIPVRNMCWLLDIPQIQCSDIITKSTAYCEDCHKWVTDYTYDTPTETAESVKADLELFMYTAKHINTYIDNNAIEGDTVATWALLGFLSRVWPMDLYWLAARAASKAPGV
jgi:hypothetical protein